LQREVLVLRRDPAVTIGNALVNPARIIEALTCWRTWLAMLRAYVGGGAGSDAGYLTS
jgi:hypothetical protein